MYKFSFIWDKGPFCVQIQKKELIIPICEAISCFVMYQTHSKKQGYHWTKTWSDWFSYPVFVAWGTHTELMCWSFLHSTSTDLPVCISMDTLVQSLGSHCLSSRPTESLLMNAHTSPMHTISGEDTDTCFPHSSWHQAQVLWLAAPIQPQLQCPHSPRTHQYLSSQ